MPFVSVSKHVVRIAAGNASSRLDSVGSTTRTFRGQQNKRQRGTVRTWTFDSNILPAQEALHVENLVNGIGLSVRFGTQGLFATDDGLGPNPGHSALVVTTGGPYGHGSAIVPAGTALAYPYTDTTPDDWMAFAWMSTTNTDGSWQHVAISSTGDQYIDGVLTPSAGVDNLITESAGTFSLNGKRLTGVNGLVFYADFVVLPWPVPSTYPLAVTDSLTAFPRLPNAELGGDAVQERGPIEVIGTTNDTTYRSRFLNGQWVATPRVVGMTFTEKKRGGFGVFSGAVRDIRVNPIANQNAVAGTAFSFTPVAQGGEPPYTWSSVGTALPAWATLNTSTGEISGTPTGSGVISGLVLRASDGNTQGDSNPFSITVQASALSISYPEMAPVLGEAFSATPTIENSFGTTVFAIDSGALPDGLTLDTGTGEISGVLTIAGLLSAATGQAVTVRVTDDAGTATDATTVTSMGVPIPAPTAYWSMDTGTIIGDRLRGQVPPSPDGTIAGTVTTVPGTVNQALRYDGSTNNVAFAAGQLNFSPSTPLSISAHIRTSATTNMPIMGNWVISSSAGFVYEVRAGDMTFAFWDAGATAGARRFSSVDVSDGAWHAVAVTYPGSGGATAINHYADGVLANGSTPINTTAPAAPTDAVTRLGLIRRAGDINNQIYDGDQDEVAVWDLVLTANQAATLNWLRLRAESILSWVDIDTHVDSFEDWT